MNIDDLTLGQIKEIKNMVGKQESNLLDSYMVGKTVMIRSYSSGVHFGVLVRKEGQTVLLKDAQRIHYWVEACSLSQLAKEGSKNFDGCRISVVVDEILIEQVIEVIPMSEATTKLFREAKIWKK